MVKAALEALTKASHKMAEELYKTGTPNDPTQAAQSAPPPPGAPSEEKKPGDDVVDAEYEEAPRN